MCDAGNGSLALKVRLLEEQCSSLACLRTGSRSQKSLIGLQILAFLNNEPPVSYIRVVSHSDVFTILIRDNALYFYFSDPCRSVCTDV